MVVPVYGVEGYIERCADSLFNQQLDDMEFIFVDDCTPDRSMDLLQKKLEEYHPRFILKKWRVRTEKMFANSGQAAVRKHGAKMAEGDFVVYCDSDDWVEPNMYKLMYDKAIEEDADAVVCDFSFSDGENVLRTIKGCSSTDREIFIEQILLQNDPWSLCNKMFRRTSCYKADIIFPAGNMGEDFVLTTQLLLNSGKVSYVPEPLYNYFYNPASITHVDSEKKKMANFRMNKENADFVYSLLCDQGLAERYSRAIVSNKWYIKKLLWNTSFDSAKRKLWRETYKEINSSIITNSHISVKDKIKFILTYLHLFPNDVEN